MRGMRVRGGKRTGTPQEQERDAKSQVEPAGLPEGLPHSPSQALPLARCHVLGPR